jgi:hypothetical protein
MRFARSSRSQPGRRHSAMAGGRLLVLSITAPAVPSGRQDRGPVILCGIEAKAAPQSAASGMLLGRAQGREIVRVVPWENSLPCLQFFLCWSVSLIAYPLKPPRDLPEAGVGYPEGRSAAPPSSRQISLHLCGHCAGDRPTVP